MICVLKGIGSMTRKKLEQYRSLVAEIEETQERIRNNMASDMVIGSDASFPYTQHAVRIEGVRDEGALRRDTRILSTLRSQVTEIEKWISEIPDSMTRRIFRMRYTDGKVRPSWQWIAFKIGHTNESTTRKIHNRFLKLSENSEK